MPRRRAALGETSRMRCFTKGSRSVTTTSADLPLAVLVTLAFVPSGNVGLASHVVRRERCSTGGGFARGVSAISRRRPRIAAGW